MKKSVLKPELNWLSNPEVFRVNRIIKAVYFSH